MYRINRLLVVGCVKGFYNNGDINFKVLWKKKFLIIVWLVVGWEIIEKFDIIIMIIILIMFYWMRSFLENCKFDWCVSICRV